MVLRLAFIPCGQAAYNKDGVFAGRSGYAAVEGAVPLYDAGLSKQGVIDSQHLGSFVMLRIGLPLVPGGERIIFSSPFLCARETTQIITETLYDINKPTVYYSTNMSEYLGREGARLEEEGESLSNVGERVNSRLSPTTLHLYRTSSAPFDDNDPCYSWREYDPLPYETVEMLDSRVESFIASVRKLYRDGVIYIITHTSVIDSVERVTGQGDRFINGVFIASF